jgi:hypothetical protein
MAVSVRKARDYVYGSGVVMERALFSYLLEDGPLEHLHRCLLAYKNPDGGWGHGMEHDLKTPDSNPLALEYLLSLLCRYDIPVGDLLDGTPLWLESIQQADGTLQNPASLRDYPIAPWWNEWGGQKQPDSIVGNLTKLGLVTPKLAETTRQWAQANHSLESIAANEWLFMGYHAFDYFMNVTDFPDVYIYRAAVIQNLVDCAAKMPAKQYYDLFYFAPTPDSWLAKALPNGFIDRCLDHFEATQRDDGGWDDQHNMPHWQPSVTIRVLMALKRYGRL